MWVRTYRQATFEPGARLKPEDLIEPEIADAFVDRTLPVLALHLGQNQFGRIAVVKATKVSLYFQQLFGAIERHVVHSHTLCQSRLTA